MKDSGALNSVWNEFLHSESTEKVALIRTVFDSLMMVALFATGTFALFADDLNGWLRVGLAILLYGYAWRHLTFNDVLRAWVRLSPASVLRMVWTANMIAGCFCGIGLMLIGGPVGWLGAAVSVVWVTAWAWILQRSAGLLESLKTKPAP